MKSSCLLESFEIVFNHFRADHIRLILNTAEQNTVALTGAADSFFKAYFTHARYPQPEIKLPVPGIFYPLQTNMIYYGLYTDLVYYAYDSFKLVQRPDNFKVTFSALMIDELSVQTIDDELLIVFGIYLHLIIFRIISLQNAIIRNCLFSAGQFADLHNMQDKFLLNQEIFSEIYNDVNDPYTSSTAIKRFENLCMEEIQRIGELNNFNTSVLSDQAAEFMYASITGLIQEQLGLSEEQNDEVYYFVQAILNDQLKKHELS